MPARGVTRSMSRSGGADSQGQEAGGHSGVMGRGESRVGVRLGGAGVAGTGMGAGQRARAEEWRVRGWMRGWRGPRRRAAARRPRVRMAGGYQMTRCPSARSFSAEERPNVLEAR